MGLRQATHPAATAGGPSDLPSDAHLSAAADLLKVLAHPVRLAIVALLEPGPMCVHEIVDALGVSQPLASQHLRILRTARLIFGERRGREIAYGISDDHVAHIVRDAITHSNEESS